MYTHNVRWLHISRLKDVFYCLMKVILSWKNCSRLSFGIRDTIYNWESPIVFSYCSHAFSSLDAVDWGGSIWPRTRRLDDSPGKSHPHFPLRPSFSWGTGLRGQASEIGAWFCGSNKLDLFLDLVTIAKKIVFQIKVRVAKNDNKVRLARCELKLTNWRNLSFFSHGPSF